MGKALPPYTPRIIGPGSLSRFNTADDLHTFILERMPWQAPGVLDGETDWQLTAFLLRANDLNFGSEQLSPQNAAQVHLREGVAGEFSMVAPEASAEDDIVAMTDNRFEVDRIWLGLFGIALAMLLLIGVVGLSFNRARRESHNPTEDQNKTE